MKPRSNLPAAGGLAARAPVRASLLAGVVLLLFSCAPAEPDGPAAADDGAADPQRHSLQPLRVGLMPAVDTAPMFVAQDSGYFTDLGLDVSFELFTSGQDRQAALQSGAIDGAMTDLVAVAVNVAGGFDIRATTLTDGMFPILARPGAQAAQSVRVGVMEVSVANFLVDQWLAGERTIEKVFITAIPARLEALAAGQLDMGLFPEPIATVGAARGLEKLIFEPVDGFSPDVMVFTGTARREKQRELVLFHQAYNRAVADIQADESLARRALVTNIPNVPADLADDITLPRYYPARLPTDAYLRRIIDWTDQMVSFEGAVEPADLVDPQFLGGDNAQ